MTTPQSILYELHYKLDEVVRFIEGNEDAEGIIGRVAVLEEQNDDIIIALQRIENQLSLIIQVLCKKNAQ
jgi:hypothetical protein